MEGVIVVNKPPGITSHDVVGFIRRKFKMRRVGHAGTLDPLATGVLVMLLGKSTKLFDRFVAFDKSYRATLRLGTKTTTADIMGQVIEEKPFSGITSANTVLTSTGVNGGSSGPGNVPGSMSSPPNA